MVSKKRYYIPFGVLGIFVIIGLANEPDNNTGQQETQNAQTGNQQVKRHNHYTSLSATA